MENTDETASFTHEFEDIITNIGNIKTCITKLTMQLKTLEKDVKKKMKIYEKQTSKKIVHRKPSGFAEPVTVSSELKSFMKLNEDDKVARTEVTKYMASYIKEHNLKSTDNGRVIIPNEALGNLLGSNNDDVITFFNLQRFMNKHFINISKNA